MALQSPGETQSSSSRACVCVCTGVRHEWQLIVPVDASAPVSVESAFRLAEAAARYGTLQLSLPVYVTGDATSASGTPSFVFVDVVCADGIVCVLYV